LPEQALTGTATQHTSSKGTTASSAAKTVPKSENVPGLSSAVYQLSGGGMSGLFMFLVLAYKMYPNLQLTLCKLEVN